jgi:hypothetical protein
MAMATSNHSSVPEGFKEIPGYDGRYFINQEGHVWSALKTRLMSEHFDASGHYLTAPLSRKGETMRPRLIHHLMAVVWMDVCPGEWGASRGKHQVNHKNGDKTNNKLCNLEWLKHEENLRHAWNNGLQNFGETRPNAYFTSEQVREIRLRLILGEKVKEIAKGFSATTGSIKHIQQFTAWKRQDWDLVEPMMQVCGSKWLQVTLDCIHNGGEFWDYSRPRVP